MAFYKKLIEKGLIMSYKCCKLHFSYIEIIHLFQYTNSKFKHHNSLYLGDYFV